MVVLEEELQQFLEAALSSLTLVTYFLNRLSMQSALCANIE